MMSTDPIMPSETTNQGENKVERIQSLLKTLKKGFLVKDFEDIFRLFSYIIIGIFLFFFNGVLQFRAYAQEHNITTASWNSLFASIVTVFLLFGLKHFIKTTCWDWTMENLNEKYVGPQREFRAKKILKWIYDTIYYSATTAFSLWAFRNSQFMPSLFGGKGECSSLMNTYPEFPSGPGSELLLFYHFVQLGSHTFSFLELVFLRRKEEHKFYEYTLHHFMAAGLIFYSGMFNFFYTSALVLMIHDMGDIIVAGGRAYADMKFKSKYVLYSIMVMALIVWICTRIIIFPSCVLYVCWNFMGTGSLELWDIIKYCYVYKFIQLMILLFMHCYWTLFMLKIAIGYLVKPSYSNVYDNKDFKKIKPVKKE